MEENLFPSIQSLNSRTDLEEERRLFYVAVTRAQELLTLSFAENRYRWGTPTTCEPSRFLTEIPEKYIDFPKKSTPSRPSFSTGNNWSASLPGVELPQRKPAVAGNFRKVTPAPETPPSPTPVPDGPPSDVEDIQTGMDVMHERFGKGKVVNIEGVGPNKKATVFFPAIGQKQLLLRFARLRIVN
jgi:DNA helicase-2/ATP-dependent DNA helicase PcrA